MSQPDSRDNQRDQTRDTGESTQPEAGQSQAAQDGQQATGDILPSPLMRLAGDDVSRAKILAASVMNRLKAQKLWFGVVDLVRDQMMREAKATIPDLVQRQLWVYSELDRMYPPVCPVPISSDIISELLDVTPLVAPNPISESGAIQGLADLPKGWPELPANASLSTELGWVQANRLFMVEERPGKATRVRLDQAASPAPSRAALGWLETSIRSYAKFVDAVAKVSGGDDGDEGAVMRRERKSIDEVRALLAEMDDEPTPCPHCGKLID